MTLNAEMTKFDNIEAAKAKLPKKKKSIPTKKIEPIMEDPEGEESHEHSLFDDTLN